VTAKKHATSPLESEFTLCGVASDVNAVEPSEETPVFADAGIVVTCLQCRTVIEACRKFGPQFRVPT